MEKALVWSAMARGRWCANNSVVKIAARASMSFISMVTMRYGKMALDAGNASCTVGLSMVFIERVRQCWQEIWSDFYLRDELVSIQTNGDDEIS